jgi:hypothetical protein
MADSTSDNFIIAYPVVISRPSLLHALLSFGLLPWYHEKGPDGRLGLTVRS